jgi:hypothetical protein
MNLTHLVAFFEVARAGRVLIIIYGLPPFRWNGWRRVRVQTHRLDAQEAGMNKAV